MRIFKHWFLAIVMAPDGSAGGGGGAAAAPAAGGAAAGAGAAPGAAESAGAGGAAAGGAPAAPQISFADSLPADLKEMAVFKDIKDLDGLARSYANAAKMVGLDKGRIVALPADGDDAAWTEMYAKLGRPAEPKEYGFKPPEGVTVDEKLQENFANTAHKLGLSTKQANELYAWWNGEAAQARGALQAQTAQAEEAATTSLKSEWGAAYPQNLDLAKKALAHYGNDEVRAELEKSGIGNNPALIKVFHKMGMALSEDGLIGKGGGGGEQISSPTEARQQINALRADKAFSAAYLDKSHAGHKEAVAKMAALHQQAYPEPAKA
jgi:hypothetical protein